MEADDASLEARITATITEVNTTLNGIVGTREHETTLVRLWQACLQPGWARYNRERSSGEEVTAANEVPGGNAGQAAAEEPTDDAVPARKIVITTGDLGQEDDENDSNFDPDREADSDEESLVSTNGSIYASSDEEADEGFDEDDIEEELAALTKDTSPMLGHRIRESVAPDSGTHIIPSAEPATNNGADDDDDDVEVVNWSAGTTGGAADAVEDPEANQEQTQHDGGDGEQEEQEGGDDEDAAGTVMRKETRGRKSKQSGGITQIAANDLVTEMMERGDLLSPSPDIDLQTFLEVLAELCVSQQETPPQARNTFQAVAHMLSPDGLFSADYAIQTHNAAMAAVLASRTAIDAGNNPPEDIESVGQKDKAFHAIFRVIGPLVEAFKDAATLKWQENRQSLARMQALMTLSERSKELSQAQRNQARYRDGIRGRADPLRESATGDPEHLSDFSDAVTLLIRDLIPAEYNTAETHPGWTDELTTIRKQGTCLAALAQVSRGTHLLLVRLSWPTLFLRVNPARFEAAITGLLHRFPALVGILNPLERAWNRIRRKRRIEATYRFQHFTTADEILQSKLTLAELLQVDKKADLNILIGPKASIETIATPPIAPSIGDDQGQTQHFSNLVDDPDLDNPDEEMEGQ